MKYSKALDHILIAASLFKRGKHQEAASHFAAAADSEDFDATLEQLNNDQSQSIDNEDGGQFAKALASARSRIKKVVVKAAESEVTLEDDLVDEAEEEMSESNSEDDTLSLDDEETAEVEDKSEEDKSEEDKSEEDKSEEESKVESASVKRMKRAAFNARVLARK